MYDNKGLKFVNIIINLSNMTKLKLLDTFLQEVSAVAIKQIFISAFLSQKVSLSTLMYYFTNWYFFLYTATLKGNSSVKKMIFYLSFMSTCP